MISIENLSFSYGKNEFIKDLTLTFSNSSITAVVGENGSGKTTLLSLISKELSKRSGRIEIDGCDTDALKRNELARLVSVFPQNRETPDMTALELAVMGRYPYTKNKLTVPQSDIEAAKCALIRVGAEQFSSQRLQALSYGERQRVYLAMQVAQNAQNLLLDEPTNFLDISARFQTMDLLSSLKNEGKCIVTVIHDITLALTYADRIAVMKNGKLAAFDTPEEIYRNKSIEQVFGIKILRYDRDGKPIYHVEPK